MNINQIMESINEDEYEEAMWNMVHEGVIPVEMYDFARDYIAGLPNETQQFIMWLVENVAEGSRQAHWSY